jgi:hypothetical protein
VPVVLSSNDTIFLEALGQVLQVDSITDAV